MDEFPEFLKKMIEHIEMGSEKGSWVNVARLSPVDILKKKDYDMRTRRLFSQAKVLHSKLKVIYATIQSEKDELWDGFYANYNLPSDLSYKIDDKGQVIKYVPEPPAENP